jgi:pyruvate,water dikinase
MIGYRGASRYITDIETFKLELAAIKKVRKEYNNLWVMIPFVRTVNELAQTVKIMESEGLKRSEDFKLWMMVEVPSNIFLLEKFLNVGIDGISILFWELTGIVQN